VRASDSASSTSSSQSACASESSGGRDRADRPGSPITSTAYTRNCVAQAGTSPSQIAEFEPEPWSSSTGGALSGPLAMTNVSPSRVGTRSSCRAMGH
jgi:hypothetical protein